MKVFDCPPFSEYRNSCELQFAVGVQDLLRRSSIRICVGPDVIFLQLCCEVHAKKGKQSPIVLVVWTSSSSTSHARGPSTGVRSKLRSFSASTMFERQFLRNVTMQLPPPFSREICWPSFSGRLHNCANGWQLHDAVFEPRVRRIWSFRGVANS